MDQKQIERINELSRKARSPEGLTEWEEQERAALRREYVDAVLGNLKGQPGSEQRGSYHTDSCAGQDVKTAAETDPGPRRRASARSERALFYFP